MSPAQNRWLQLAHVAICAALAEVECSDQALMEALFVGMPGIRIQDVTAAAVAEALRRADSLRDAAAALECSPGFIYDSLRRRRREWVAGDWVGYGAELRRRRLLAGWSVEELSRRARLSGTRIRQIERGEGRLRPSELTLAKLAVVLGMPMPPPRERSTQAARGESPKEGPAEGKPTSKPE